MARGSERAARLSRSGPGRLADASFLADGDQVAGLLPMLVSGIPLGTAREVNEAGTEPEEALRTPLRLELFGSRPREIVVLGRPDLSRLTALRAAACGAAVAVAAADARPWRALLDAVGGQEDLLTLLDPATPVMPPVPPDQPLLLVVDGLLPDALVLPPGRHSTMWVADPGTVEALEPVLARADVLVLGQGHADVVARGLELAGAAPRLGTMMSSLEPDEVLLTSPRSAVRRVSVIPTAVEYRLLGPEASRTGAPAASDPPEPSPRP